MEEVTTNEVGKKGNQGVIWAVIVLILIVVGVLYIANADDDAVVDDTTDQEEMVDTTAEGEMNVDGDMSDDMDVTADTEAALEL